MKKFKTYIISILLAYITVSCGGSPLQSGSDQKNLKLEFIIPTERHADRIQLAWKCSASVEGSVTYFSTDGIDNPRTIFSIFETKHHWATLAPLRAGIDYDAIVTCGKLVTGVRSAMRIRSGDDFFSSVRGSRAIWIFGGISGQSEPVSEVDVYDPVDNIWYPSVTTLPNPRAYAGIIEYNGLVYVFGGMTKVAGAWGATNRAQVYDPRANVWTDLPNLPFPWQGGVVGSDGEGIYLISGTQSDNMVNDTVLNRIMRYRPKFRDWTVSTSLTAVFPRMDMGHCNLDGSIYYTGGRFYADGTSNATSDSYIPSLNSTTSINEASLSQARHGVGVTCVKPEPTDPFPSDPKGVIAVGGSTSDNVAQPVISILPSNRFEFFQSGIGTNTYTTGLNLPASVYYPAVGVSYQTRKIFVFGGATAVNLPTRDVFGISSSNPTGSAWESNFERMPRARFGHKALLIGRTL